MSVQDMLCDASKLKSLDVTLNGYSIAMDDLESVELKMSMFQPYVNGFIQFKDTANYTNTTSLKFDGSTIVKITATDIIGTEFKRSFNVVDMDIDDSNPRLKRILLKLMDSFSYKLSTTYMSKGFTTNVVDAFVSCMNNISANTLLSQDSISTDFVSSSDSDTFVVPQNQSVLDFFVARCRLNNVRMYQDNNTVHLKEFTVSDAEEKQFDGSNITYTDNTFNNNYMFKIYDFNKVNASKAKTTFKLQTNINYRFTGKTVDTETFNLEQFYQTLLLNSSSTDASLQDATGTQKTVSYTPVGAQKYDLFNTFIKANQLACTIKGNFGYTIPGVKANVKMKSNSYSTKQQYAGSPTDSGYYIITSTCYKFFNYRFLQQVMFSRFDNPDPTVS